MAKKIGVNLFKKKEIQIVDSRPLDDPAFSNGLFQSHDGKGSLFNNEDHSTLLSTAKNVGITKLPPPPSKTKPTIIRASKSSENILDLNQSQFNEGKTSGPADNFTSISNAFDPWGSMVNPSFRLESQKAKPAPSIPSSTSSHQLSEKSSTNNQMFKKKPPPPRPSSRPGQGKLANANSAWHKSTSDINLLSFDPLFNTCTPSANNNPNSKTSEELENIFSKRLSSSQSAFNFDNYENPSSLGRTGSTRGNYTQDLASIDWSTASGPAAPRIFDKPSGISEPHAVAIYDYDSGTEGDLVFRCGDVILLTEVIDQDWFRGRVQHSTQNEGMFPQTFVEIKVPLKAVSSSPTPPPASHNIFPISPKPALPSKPTLLPNPFKATVICPPRQHNQPVEMVLPMKPEPRSHDLDTVDSLSQSSNAPPVLRAPSGGGSGVSVRQRASMFESSGEHDVTPTPPKPIPTPPKKLPHAKLTAAVPPMPVPQPQPRKSRMMEGDASTTESRGTSEEIAVALYDYSSNTPGDLAFKCGDKIIITQKIDSNWIRGKLLSSNQKEGIFPANFVQFEAGPVVAPPPSSFSKPEPDDLKKSNSDSRWVKAIYDFESVESDDLPFNAGDKIRLTGNVSAEWLTGEMIGGGKGQFPHNFVEPLTKAELLNFSKSRPQAEVLFDFPGDADGDLPLQVGSTVYLMSQIDSDWYKGESPKNGEMGIFPSAFVRVKTALP